MATKLEKLIPVKGGTEKKKPYIELTVNYTKGGMSFATYRQVKRGYYISATPVTIEDTEVPGLIVKGFMAFSGVKQLIEEAGRLNQKRVRELFDEAVADYEAKRGPAYALVQHILTTNGLELAEEPVPVPA